MTTEVDEESQASNGGITSHSDAPPYHSFDESDVDVVSEDESTNDIYSLGRILYFLVV